MLSRLKNMFKVADLRGKVLFTVLIIGVFRLGCHIPLPYVDFGAIQQVQNQAKLGGAVEDCLKGRLSAILRAPQAARADEGISEEDALRTLGNK